MTTTIKLTVAVFFFLMIGIQTAAADKHIPVYFFQIEDQWRYVYPSDMETLNWREIRERRELYKTAREDMKQFHIEMTEAGTNADIFNISAEAFLKTASLFMRDPNGDIRPLSLSSEKTPYIGIPDGEELNGRYLLGAHLNLGEQDMDGDGTPESVATSAKYLTYHRKEGGKVGSASVVFIDDPARMPLEIGPKVNTAKSRYGGSMQSAHREYEMMVKYQGKPVSGVPVTVLSIESRWKKSFVTDADGIFKIMPTDDRSVAADFQNYLFTATHHDREKRKYHIATFPVTVYKNRPEWRTKTVGFIYWAILGTGMTILTVFGFIIRKKRRYSRQLAVFENHRIKDERP